MTQAPLMMMLPEAFTETDSGLNFRILRKSDGDKATANDSVTVNYRGWLDDGTEFDSSYKRGEPISFPLGGVIPGWTEGMQLIGVGGMIELTIPAELGYGQRGAGADVSTECDVAFHRRVDQRELDRGINASI